MKTARELKDDGLTPEQIAARLELTVLEVERLLELDRISPQQRIEVWQRLQKKRWPLPVAVAFAAGVLGGGSLALVRLEQELKDDQAVTLSARARAAAVVSFQATGKLTVLIDGLEVGEVVGTPGLHDILIPPEALHGDEQKLTFDGPGRAFDIRVERLFVPLPYDDGALQWARERMDLAERVGSYESWLLYRDAWRELQRARIQPFDDEQRARAGVIAARERMNDDCATMDAPANWCPTDEAKPRYMPPGPADFEPEVIGEVKVPYPEEAKRAGVEGTVNLRLTVDFQGNVIDAKLINGPGYGLDEAALDAVKQFKFKPATRAGEAVSTTIRYKYTFLLD